MDFDQWKGAVNQALGIQGAWYTVDDLDAVIAQAAFAGGQSPVIFARQTPAPTKPLAAPIVPQVIVVKRLSASQIVAVIKLLEWIAAIYLVFATSGACGAVFVFTAFVVGSSQNPTAHVPTTQTFVIAAGLATPAALVAVTFALGYALLKGFQQIIILLWHILESQT